MDRVRTLRVLRELLDAVSYTEDGIQRAMGAVPHLVIASDVPVLLRRLSDERPLATLIKLFLLGHPIGTDEASAVSLDIEALESVGFLTSTGDRVRATVQLVPYRDLIVAHDPELSAARASDHIMGVSASSRTLAQLTVRRPGSSALDLGTGCGFQALLAASHATTVVATDVNDRALRLARCNARLNGISNVEFRQGDLFEPVAESTFDLVVCNPPFVVSPDSTYAFRDGGLPGDEMSRRVVSGVCDVLRKGGFATIMCNWVLHEGELWTDGPRSWIAERGCDAWLLHHRTDDPLNYAASIVDVPELLDRWLAYYNRRRITGIASGVIVLRGRTSSGWFRTDEMPLGPTGPAGEHIVRVFETEDWLRTVRDERLLLSEVLRLVDRHRLDQTLTYSGGYAVNKAELVLDESVGVVGEVAPHAVHVLFRLDGSRRLCEAIEEAAREIGLRSETLIPDAVATVRRLLELGFVIRDARPPR